MREYHEDGVSFRYPDDWELDRQEADGGWVATVQSPGTAFLMLTYDPGMPTAEDMAETALEALKEEYPGLESEPAVETLAGQPAVGHDIQFFAMDLTNTCWTRSLYTEGGTLLLIGQVADLDIDTYERPLRAIAASLAIEAG